MTRDPEQRILDACLEEILGGHYPPDLSAKILQTWEARRQRQASDRAAGVLPAPRAADGEPSMPAGVFAEGWNEPVPPPGPWETAVAVRTRTQPGRRRHAPWLPVALAGSLLVAAALAGLYLKARGKPTGDLMVESPPDQPGAGALAQGDDAGPMREVRIRKERFAAAPSGRNSPPQEEPFAGTDVVEPAASPPEVGPSDAALPKPPRPEPLADAEVIAFVDRALREAWREHSVTPAPPASDRQWCRRVYDRLLGRNPTEDELDRFLRSRKADKRKELVDRLLASDAYARRWARIWSDVMLGPLAVARDGAPDHRVGLERYLDQSLRAGKPYDAMARELLVATGSDRPGAEDYNPAVHFLLAGATDNAVGATDRVARVFLGRQLACTQCHDHPAGDWKAGEFWKLNAFFRQMRIRRDRQTAAVRLVDEDFYGESGAGKDAEIFYSLPGGRLKIAYPELDGHELPHSGLLGDVNRRKELARLVTGSDDFRRAAVNWVWSRLWGYGFTQPVDDMGPHHPPSHPELVDRLAEQLAAHDFQLRSLVRWIVLSESFGLSSQRTAESWMDAPERGGKPLFARWYTQPERPLDVYRTLMAAVDSRSAPASRMAGAMARRSWVRPADGVLEIIDTEPSETLAGPPWLARLSESGLAPERKIEHLFLAALGRKPSRRERIAARLVLADRLNDALALHDIWQALVANGR